MLILVILKDNNMHIMFYLMESLGANNQYFENFFLVKGQVPNMGDIVHINQYRFKVMDIQYCINGPTTKGIRTNDYHVEVGLERF